MSNKLKAKNRPKTVSIGGMTIYDVSRETGTKIETLKRYLKARENEIFEGVRKEAQENILKAEDYITVSNILCSMWAIHETWGYTKSIQRFIDNYNAASQALNKMGVQDMYNMLHEMTGVEIEFDNVDLNKEFGFGDD